MSIKNVRIKNFTVFNDIEIEFGKGVNVIIGENGTGKTHLMKAMYVHNLKMNQDKKADMDDYFKASTIPYRLQEEMYVPNEQISLIKKEPDLTIFNLARESHISVVGNTNKSAVYIPAKDMLTHSKGLLEMAKKYSKDMPFDKTLLDIIEISKYWKVNTIPEIGLNVLLKLEKLIGGKVVLENDTFYIKKTNGDLTEFSMEAEGIKKIAILWQLIMNESITKGSVLFWDEPEANINPSLYKDVAEILLELSRNGVQIFFATHNYNFAKYMEVLSEDSDNVHYHSLYKTDDGVKCETETKFALLSNNALREDNINLYDAEMKKEFEE